MEGGRERSKDINRGARAHLNGRSRREHISEVRGSVVAARFLVRCIRVNHTGLYPRQFLCRSCQRRRVRVDVASLRVFVILRVCSGAICC